MFFFFSAFSFFIAALNQQNQLKWIFAATAEFSIFSKQCRGAQSSRTRRLSVYRCLDESKKGVTRVEEINFKFLLIFEHDWRRWRDATILPTAFKVYELLTASASAPDCSLMSLFVIQALASCFLLLHYNGISLTSIQCCKTSRIIINRLSALICLRATTPTGRNPKLKVR